MSNDNDDWSGDGEDSFVEVAESGRDRPLVGCWRLEGFAEIQPELLGRGKHREARLLILGEALVNARLYRGRSISYSRRREYYGPTRYRPEALTFATVTQAVDALAEAGVLYNNKALPGGRGQQSRFGLTPSGWNMLFGRQVLHCKTELVVLRDANKNLADYVDTAETERMRHNLRIINEALRTSAIEFDSRSVSVGQAIFDGKGYIASHNDLHRVFNRGRFDLGGRFYGPWWQNVPSGQRKKITISGNVTCEEDYNAIHPTLLYAQCGTGLVGDPYDLAGWERKTVKLAFNIFVNATGDVSAVQALAPYIGGEGAFAKAKQILADILIKHEPIADQFCTGAGLGLQRVDSDMAERVMLDLMIEKGIVCLSIHDSFVVDAKERSVLQETMDKVLEMAKRKLSGKPHPQVGYSKNVPQYGERTPQVPARLPGVVAAHTPQAEAAPAANDNAVSASWFAETA